MFKKIKNNFCISTGDSIRRQVCSNLGCQNRQVSRDHPHQGREHQHLVVSFPAHALYQSHFYN